MQRALGATTLDEERHLLLKLAAEAVAEDSTLETWMEFEIQFQESSDEVRRDSEVALKAVSLDGGLLRFCGESSKSDPEIVKAAVESCPTALLHANRQLEGFRELVIWAVQNFWGALQYAPPELRSDPEVVLEAVKTSSCELQHASRELRGDKNIVLAAIGHHAGALGFASPELQGDKEVVMHAMKRQAAEQLGARNLLHFASEELKADRDVVLEASKIAAPALPFASRELQNDKDFVLLAARQSPTFKVKRKVEVGNWIAAPDFDSFRDELAAAACSVLACTGESGPVLTVHPSTRLNEEKSESVEPDRFRCEVALLSGKTFPCELAPDLGSETPDPDGNSTSEPSGQPASEEPVGESSSTPYKQPAGSSSWEPSEQPAGASSSPPSKRPIGKSSSKSSKRPVGNSAPGNSKLTVGNSSREPISKRRRVEDLAKLVRAELPKQTEVKDVERFFMVIANSDGSATHITPWEHARPLSDFC